jgi:hypothetical protein
MCTHACMHVLAYVPAIFIPFWTFCMRQHCYQHPALTYSPTSFPLGRRYLIAAGDPLQLPPVVASPVEVTPSAPSAVPAGVATPGMEPHPGQVCTDAGGAGGLPPPQGLVRPLFVRLAALGHTPHLLRQQYRCHPDIAAVPNHQFYNGQLLDGVGAAARPPILPGLPTVLCMDVRGQEQYSGVGRSVSNSREAAAVVDVVMQLLERGMQVRYPAFVYVLKERMRRDRRGSGAIRVWAPCHTLIFFCGDATAGAVRHHCVLPGSGVGHQKSAGAAAARKRGGDGGRGGWRGPCSAAAQHQGGHSGLLPGDALKCPMYHFFLDLSHCIPSTAREGRTMTVPNNSTGKSQYDLSRQLQSEALTGLTLFHFLLLAPLCRVPKKI